MSDSGDDRRITRALRNQLNVNLQLPLRQGRGRGSRSPSPLRVNDGRAFEFRPAEMDPEQFQLLLMATQEQNCVLQDTLRRQTKLIQQMTNQRENAVPRVRPELPPFDRHNVEFWIKRVENAFSRANVTLAPDKFL